MYRYRIASTKESSSKYGTCEVCGKYVSEVFVQTEERRYPTGWTQDKCLTIFGHKECLENRQRTEG